jgi:hypothetical protein
VAVVLGAVVVLVIVAGEDGPLGAFYVVARAVGAGRGCPLARWWRHVDVVLQTDTVTELKPIKRSDEYEIPGHGYRK